MEIIRDNPLQFKPVVLYMPGHERYDRKWKGFEPKPRFKKQPELWRTYKKLSAVPTEKPTSEKFDCKYGPPTISYPEKDGLKCMCYEKLMQMLREQVCITPPRVYRVQKEFKPKIRIEGIRPSWMKRAVQGFHENQMDQYPLQTVIIRWQLKRKLPKYNPETLKYILAPYGDIREIQILSPNSCLIIFKDISSACRVMQSRCLGDPLNKLNFSWWHKSMANKCVATRANGVSIKTDVFIV